MIYVITLMMASVCQNVLQVLIICKALCRLTGSGLKLPEGGYLSSSSLFWSSGSGQASLTAAEKRVCCRGG